MTDIWPVLWALVVGGVAAEAVLPAPAPPGWRRWVWRAALAVPVGLGVTSLLAFACIWAGIATAPVVLALEMAIVLAGGFWVLRRRGAAEEPASVQRAHWLMHAAAAAGFVLFCVHFQTVTAGQPYGEWDASSIWNLRARFLAEGEAWRHAVAPDLNAELTGASHPGYPLLVSGFVGRGWILTGGVGAAVPAAAAFASGAATLLLLLAALVWLHGETAALAAVVVLAATEGWVSQTPSQYADVPLSLLLLGITVLLAAGQRTGWNPRAALLLGLLAGCAAWTKNEGLVVALAALAAVAWLGGSRTGLWAAAGAAPGLAATAALKFGLVSSTESLIPATAGGIVAFLTDAGRWWAVVSGYGGAIVDLGFGFSHPLLLLAALAAALGWAAREERIKAAAAAAPALALLLAGFATLLLTTANQQWHIGTTVNRLLAQAWPALLFTGLLWLAPPPAPRAPAAPPDPVPPPSRRPRPRPRSG